MSTPKRRRGPSRAFTPPTDRRIRCQCLNTSAKFELIECTECATWQHRNCMPLTDDTTNYKCEMCAPMRDVREAKKKKKMSKKPWSLSPENKSLVELIEQKSIDIGAPLSLNQILMEHKSRHNIERAPRTLLYHFRKYLAPNIHNLEGYDDETKARMLYATSTPVEKEFFEKLQLIANEIELDAFNRIQEYHSDTLHLSGKHIGTYGVRSNRTGRRLTRKAPTRPETRQQADDEDDDVEIVISDGETMCQPTRIKKEPMDLVPRDYFEQDDTPSTIAYSTMDYSNPSYYTAPSYSMIPAVTVLQGMSQLVNSLTGIVQAQTQMIRECRARPSTTVTSTTVPHQNQSISVVEFLKFIQKYILELNRLQLSDILHKVLIQIQNLNNTNDGNKKIDNQRMKIALESAFSIAFSSISNGANLHQQRDTVDSKQFLNAILIYASQVHLYDFCGQIKEKIDKLDDGTTIQIDKIRIALEAAIGIVSQ